MSDWGFLDDDSDEDSNPDINDMLDDDILEDDDLLQELLAETADELADNVTWAAQPGSQTLFLQCPVFEVLLSGTRGGGKTDALIMDFVQHVGVGWGPDWRGILFRETYKQLDDVKKKCRKWIPQMFPTAAYNKQEHTWTFPDGEQLLLRHMKTEEDYQNYHGHEYPFIAFEELTNWASDGCYRLMMSCCRSSVDPKKRDKFGRPLPRKIRATTNPYGKGHNWIKKRFQLPQMMGKIIRVADDPIEEGEVQEEIRPRVAIHSHFDENIKLKESEPNYRQSVKAAARNPAEEAAWLRGTWDITSGGMFDDIWDVGVHVLDPFTIPKEWRINRSFDWGSSKPASVGWWAESDGSDVVMPDGSVRSTVRGDLFRIMEWYVAGPGDNKGLRLTAAEVATGIVLREIQAGLREKITGKTRVRKGPADSSIWDDSGGPSIAAQMSRPVRIDGASYSGVSWEKADKSPGSRKNGWEAIRQMLRDAKKDENGIREKPGLFVFRECKSFCSTVPSLPRDDRDPDDVDTEAEDHIGDETRYRIMTPRRVMKQRRTRGTH